MYLNPKLHLNYSYRTSMITMMTETQLITNCNTVRVQPRLWVTPDLIQYISLTNWIVNQGKWLWIHTVKWSSLRHRSCDKWLPPYVKCDVTTDTTDTGVKAASVAVVFYCYDKQTKPHCWWLTTCQVYLSGYFPAHQQKPLLIKSFWFTCLLYLQLLCFWMQVKKKNGAIYC